MLLGRDHLLFNAGVVVLAVELRRGAKLVSVFVLGHSTTLIVQFLPCGLRRRRVGALGIWRLGHLLIHRAFHTFLVNGLQQPVRVPLRCRARRVGQTGSEFRCSLGRVPRSRLNATLSA